MFWLRTYEGTSDADPILAWHEGILPTLERFEHLSDKDKDLNFEQTAFVYQRMENCSQCNKHLLMMAFKFVVN